MVRLLLLLVVAWVLWRLVRPLLLPGPPIGDRHDADARWDPYAILGVARGASAEDITRAYREQMKLYHPDRVAGLGAELQQVANQKTRDIQRAYEEIGRG
jgi:preprotein translocase subunit Sec63